MAFRFVSSGGIVSDPAVVNVAASGLVRPGNLVDFVRSGTGGAVVAPTTSSSTTTMVFAVSMDYAQGASDTFANIVPASPTQLWEADCANAATTAQVGLRHALSASDRAVVHNTASDVTGATGLFLALAMVGASTGSGKLIGRIVSNVVPTGLNSTTFS